MQRIHTNFLGTNGGLFLLIINKFICSWNYFIKKVLKKIRELLQTKMSVYTKEEEILS